MPRSSRASLSDETIQELEDQFYDFLNSLTSDERRKFFSEFLTNEEKMMMYKRLALYWCLLEGYSLAKIQQMIGVTHDTTRVYNKKKNMLSDEFKSLLSRIGSDDKKESADLEETAQEKTDEETQEEIPQMQEETHEQIEVQDENQEHQRPENQTMEQDTPAVEDEMDKMGEPQIKVEEEITTEVTFEAEEKDIPQMTEESAETKEETSGLTPSESQNEEEKSDDDEGEGKKKSGLAKFFGF